MSEDDPRVGRLLVKTLRNIADMTQAEFSRAAGVSRSQLSSYENGHAMPSDQTLRLLAAAAGLPWYAAASLRHMSAVLLRVKAHSATHSYQFDGLDDEPIGGDWDDPFGGV